MGWGQIKAGVRKWTQKQALEAIWVEDNENIYLGTGKDVYLTFDGTNFLIKNSAGTTILTLGPTTGNLTLGGSGKIVTCSKVTGA